MPMINFANPILLGVSLLFFLVTLFLSRELKKSVIMGGTLAIYLMLSVVNCILFTIHGVDPLLRADLVTTIVFDLIFVFVSFMTYLWIDDIEAKLNKKKSLDDSLNWFWKKV